MRLLLRSSTAFWRRGVPERVAPAVFRFLKRWEIPGEQPVWFLIRRYSKGMHSTSGNRRYSETHRAPISCYLAHFISRRTKSNTAGAKNCSASKEILKKFD
jgi:hypothetical protein